MHGNPQVRFCTIKSNLFQDMHCQQSIFQQPKYVMRDERLMAYRISITPDMELFSYFSLNTYAVVLIRNTLGSIAQLVVRLTANPWIASSDPNWAS